MAITLTREEAQQVLDALTYTVEEMRSLNGQAEPQEAAIETLRARLAQPEPEYRDVVIKGDLWRVEFLPDHAASVVLVRANYEAQPEPEPVTWIPVSTKLPKSGVTVLACYKNSLGKVRRIRANWIAEKTEEASSECEFGEYDEATDCYWTPEGWYECIDNWDEYSSIAVHEGQITHWMPMPEDPYTAPPQREWQGLTDEEIEDLFMENMYCDNLVDFEHIARAIEAKLKDKNA
jgi:hypothetical protein